MSKPLMMLAGMFEKMPLWSGIAPREIKKVAKAVSKDKAVEEKKKASPRRR